MMLTLIKEHPIAGLPSLLQWQLVEHGRSATILQWRDNDMCQVYRVGGEERNEHIYVAGFLAAQIKALELIGN